MIVSICDRSWTAKPYEGVARVSANGDVPDSVAGRMLQFTSFFTRPINRLNLIKAGNVSRMEIDLIARQLVLVEQSGQ